MGNARVVCGDEISTGLDSQTTFEMVRAFRAVARLFDTTVVLSLLQPPPEVFWLHDEVVLMYGGANVYHGPSTKVLDHFNAMGYTLPKRKDVGDYLIELFSPIGAQYNADPAGAATTPEAMEAVWLESALAKEGRAALDGAPEKATWPEAFTVEFPLPLKTYTYWCLRRRYLETVGASTQLKARAIQAVVMGTFIGTLYYDQSYDDYATKIGVIFSSMMYIALGGMGDLPGTLDDRVILYKMTGASFYPPLAFVVGRTAFSVPIIVAESFVFTMIVYWLSGLASSGYLTYFLTCTLVSTAMSQWLSCVAMFAPAAEVAQPMAGMSTLFFVLFSGFVQGRKRVIQRRFYVGVLEAISERKASTL